MESALVGLVLDSSVLIAAERRNLTAFQAIEEVQKAIAEVPVVMSSVTAEIGHASTGPTRLRSAGAAVRF
jgi:hypothetical protein